MAPVQVDEPLLSLDNGIKNYSSLFPGDTAHKVHVIGKENYSKNFYNLLYNAPFNGMVGIPFLSLLFNCIYILPDDEIFHHFRINPYQLGSHLLVIHIFLPIWILSHFFSSSSFPLSQFLRITMATGILWLREHKNFQIQCPISYQYLPLIFPKTWLNKSCPCFIFYQY